MASQLPFAPLNDQDRFNLLGEQNSALLSI